MFIALHDLIIVLSPLKISTPSWTHTQLDTVHDHPFILFVPTCSV